MTDKSVVDEMLDAGAAGDWITAPYEAVRNLFQDGKSFMVTEGEWDMLLPTMERYGITHWGQNLYTDEASGQYVVSFSVQAKDARRIERWTGIQHSGGRLKAMWILLVGAFVLFVSMAIIGGAMSLVGL